MEMHHVRYFLAVEEERNFTRAAEKCNVSQPALTRAIQKLEHEVGGELFRRERSKTHLTDLGRVLLPHFQRIEEARREIDTERQDYWAMDSAPIRLGVMCTLGPTRMVPFLDQLRTDVPGLVLTIKDGPAAELSEAMMSGDLDAAILSLPDYEGRMDATPLYRENYVVGFPKGHRFEAMSRVPMSEMKGESYLKRLNCEAPEYLRSAEVGPLGVNVAFKSEREDWIQSMIAAGFGCSIMPEFLPTIPGVATRVLADPSLSREVSLVTVQGRAFSPVMFRLMNLCRAYGWNAAAA